VHLFAISAQVVADRKKEPIAAMRVSNPEIENCDAVIRVYDEAGNVVETHEHAGEFKEW
jgi:hypothetical protein